MVPVDVIVPKLLRCSLNKKHILTPKHLFQGFTKFKNLDTTTLTRSKFRTEDRQISGASGHHTLSLGRPSFLHLCTPDLENIL